VEAQSAGLPALVSSDGGLREVVEHEVSGLIIDPHDFDAWVREVQRVLNDQGVRRKLVEGGYRAAAKLSVERHADAMEAIYKKVGATNRSQRIAS
jgi:glycosyltransferase involved in cell wall biosynthesis